MAHQRFSAEDAAARTAERIRVAHARIEEAVANIQSGQQWRDYLRLQSRLHAYSGLNCLLICMAMAEAYEQGLVPTPIPTYVAGFHTWKALGRSVKKGQHGFQILAPNRHTVRTAVSADGATRSLDKGEEPGAAEHLARRQVIKGFRIEHVFAAEQTHGADLPVPPTPRLLVGEAPEGLWESITDQIHDAGFDVRLVPDSSTLGGANGQTMWQSRLVEVRADMDAASRTRTLIHELAHCLIHNPANLAATVENQPPPTRNLIEVEAESVSYVVSDAHGMATDEYSFPYVAGWAGQDGTAVVQASLTRVARAAQQIITASTAEHSTGGRVPGLERALPSRAAMQPPTAGYAELDSDTVSHRIEGVAS